MNPSQFQSRCQHIIQSLSIPSPFGLEPFRECLERHCGRTVELMPWTFTAGGTGCWHPLPDADYIFYAENTTPLHQLHIVAHEAGHMLLGHPGKSLSGEESLRFLFPSLSPALAREQLGRNRSRYDETIEREAETFAFLLLDHVGRRTPAPRLPAEQAAILRRLESAFTIPSQRTAGHDDG